MTKKTARATLAAAAVCVAVCLFQPSPSRADTYDGRTLVSVTASCEEEVKALLGLRGDIVGRSGSEYRVIFENAQLDALKASGLPARVLVEEMARDRASFANPGRCPQPNGAPCYYTASKFDAGAPPAGSLMEHLLQLQQAHPDIVRLRDIGNSADGAYDIIAAQVSLNPDAVAPEPKVRIYGNIHGDEVGGLMVACDTLDWILANYPGDARARALVEGADLWFVPMGNPWGNAHSSRYNSRGKDLNRNFSGPAGCDAPPCFSEAETQAVRDLTEVMGKRFALSLSFHGGAICFNSVYNYTSAATTEEPIFFSDRNGGPYGDAVPSQDGLAEAYKLGCTTPGFWYTNGADWYTTRGDTNDWSYWVWSDLDTTVEVSEVKWPDSSQIPTVEAQHRQAVINYMLKAFQGISGVVKETATGAPLAAEVMVTATASPTIPVPHPYQKVFTDPAAGDYHRILSPGTYRVTCSVQGQTPQTAEGVQVAADTTTTVDFSFGSTTPPPSVTATASPTQGVAPLTVSFGSSAAGGVPPYGFAWSFGDGAVSTAQNPSHSYASAGVVHPSVTVTDALGATASDTHLTVTVQAVSCTLLCSATGPTEALAGEMKAFSASAQLQNCTGTVSYLWNFGDGSTAQQKNPVHAYAAPGTYAWTMRSSVGDAVCSDGGTVTVTAPCTLSCAGSASPSSGAAPLSVQFTGSATASNCAGTALFAWDFGDGATSAAQSPSHSYAEPGSYGWTLMVSVQGLTCSRTGAVTAAPPCALTCEASAAPTSGTAPLMVQFAGSATPSNCAGAPSFAWSFGDGATSAAQSPSHSYSAPGSYAWTLTVSLEGLACSRTGTVTVAPPCTLSCEASSAPVSGQLYLVRFAATAASENCPGAPSFDWDFGDGRRSTESSPEHLYAGAGAYSWSLRVTAGEQVCARSGSVVLSAPCTLTCEASVAPPSGAAPLAVHFGGTAASDHCEGQVSFAWSFGDGTISSAADTDHIFTVAGTYGWTLDVSAGGVTCSRTGTVTVNPRLPGDEDGDGTVSIGEVQQAINAFLGLQPASDFVDCDGDGAISIGEVQRVVNAFLGLPSSC